jgi:hypothetical protein
LGFKNKMLETGQCGDVVWCKLGKIITNIKVLKLNQRQQKDKLVFTYMTNNKYTLSK